MNLESHEIQARDEDILTEAERAACLAEALEQGVERPDRVMQRAQSLAWNYAHVRDRLERLREGTATDTDRVRFPDDSFAEDDHARVQRQLGNVCRRFVLIREVDETGVSGTGIVATGVQYGNTRCALTWLTEQRSTSFYASLEAVRLIHGHGGKTRVVWCDGTEGLDFTLRMGAGVEIKFVPGDCWWLRIGSDERRASDWPDHSEPSKRLIAYHGRSPQRTPEKWTRVAADGSLSTSPAA